MDTSRILMNLEKGNSIPGGSCMQIQNMTEQNGEKYVTKEGSIVQNDTLILTLRVKPGEADNLKKYIGAGKVYFQ